MGLDGSYADFHFVEKIMLTCLEQHMQRGHIRERLQNLSI